MHILYSIPDELKEENGNFRKNEQGRLSRWSIGFMLRGNPWLVICLFVVAVVALFYPTVSSAKLRCFSTLWPSELSDLKPDPQLIRGRLSNGLRYVIKKNNKPENRVAMYLDVQAGSFQENDDQQGLAHFLEHMMFNGSTHYPPGTLVDYFQSIGMGFGNDINAHTGFEETVYHLILPHGTQDDLEKGLQVMADYARGALLLDTEIDRERGVILAEKRARDSASYRSRVAVTSYAYRGTRVPERRVIGLEKILETADRKLLKSYYDSWYRPANMVLVVVGDMNPLQVEASLTDVFAALHAEGSRPDCPEFGRLIHKGIETFYHYEPELGMTRVEIQALWDMSPLDDSITLERRELVRYIGAIIMRYRLEKLREKPEMPFTRANYYYGDIAGHIGYVSLSARTQKGNWQKSLSLMNMTLRQAIEFGVSAEEMIRAKKEIMASLESSVLREKSEDSEKIGRKIIRNINSNRVYQSADQELNLYAPLVGKITLTDINRELRKLWGHDSRLVSVTGDVGLGEHANKSISDVFQLSMVKPVAAFNKNSVNTFPYLPLPEKVSTCKMQNLNSALDIETVVFDNGLILNLKKTEFNKNSLQISVDFGYGALEEPLPGMAMIAARVINGSGTGTLTKSELDAALAGTSVDLRFRIDEGSFIWMGSSLKKDFEKLLQALYSILFDPGFRESVFDTTISRTEQMYKMIGRDIEGAVPLKILPFLASGSPHFGLVSREKITSLKYKQLAEWAKTIVPDTGFEISLVGDFDRDNVVAAIGKYFSGVELTGDRNIIPEKIVFPEGKAISVEVSTSIAKSVVFLAWPTEDFTDIHRTREFHLLAAVLEDRLRKVIREKLGATYSPEVYSSNSKVYTGYGFMAAKLIVKPGQEKKILDEILRLAEELRSEGVTEEELARAREPMLTSINETLKDNSYWLYTVLSGSSRNPEQLDWPETIFQDYSSISRQEINLLAKKYLINSKAATARVSPEIKQ